MPLELDSLLARVRAESTGIRSEVHGERHWRTVGANGLWLAERTAGADAAVVLLFALLHDTMRVNDHYDPEHGPRAAVFAESLHTDGVLRIAGAQLEVLVEACRFHTDGLTADEPTVAACWDADRLDLPRVGIEPAAHLLSTEAALAFAPPEGEPPEWAELVARL